MLILQFDNTFTELVLVVLKSLSVDPLSVFLQSKLKTNEKKLQKEILMELKTAL